MDAIILKLLEKDRDRRYAHAGDLRSDLQRLRSSAGFPRPQRRGRVYRFAARLGIVAAVVATLQPQRVRETMLIAPVDGDRGGALRQHLIAHYAGSPGVRVLRRDGAAAGPLSAEAAREACRSSVTSLVVAGAVVGLGDGYEVRLRAMSCPGGDILDDTETQAGRMEDVPKAFTELAGRLRTRAQRASPAAALAAFTAARRSMVANGARAAVPLFRRAIELDPEMPMAHAFLARSYSELDESDLAAESSRRAWQLRQRAADRDRFLIDFNYFAMVTGNLQQAQDTLETWMQTYPRDALPHGFWSSYVGRGTANFEKAESEARKSLELNPENPMVYYLLAEGLACVNRFPEAEEVLRTAGSRGLDIDEFLMLKHDLAFLKGDTAGMEAVAGALGEGRSPRTGYRIRKRTLGLCRTTE